MESQVVSLESDLHSCQTSRHLVTRIQKHIPKCLENFIQNPIELKSTAIKNAINISVISKHLVNNPSVEKAIINRDLKY